MPYQITKGKIAKPQKVLIYGPEGIGKTTLAAQFPTPLFIDIEGGTSHLDVNRLPQPTSWTMLLDELKWIRDFPQECGGTLIIDTLDWAQQLCTNYICAQKGVASVGDFDYGRGYAMVYDEYGKLINLMSDICDRGLNVVGLCHSKIGHIEQPGEIGTYDRYSLKLNEGRNTNISAMAKEWADALLFCDFKTIVTVQNEKSGKAVAQGGTRRIIHTQHSAAWDAKNRWGLPDTIDMDYSLIAPYIPIPQFQTAPVAQVPLAEEPVTKLPATPQPVNEQAIAEIDPETIPFDTTEPVAATPATQAAQSDVPPALQGLKKQITDFGLTPDVVMQALIKAKGLFPEGAPFNALVPREDLIAWIPTVLPQLRDWAKQNKLI